MKVRNSVVFASVLIAGAALLTSPASASTGDDIPPWVHVPSGATVQVLSDTPGSEIYLVQEPTPDSAIKAPKSLAVGGQARVTVGADITSYQRVAAACTQSQSMTNPLANVTVNGSATWYIPGTFSFSRSSGCTDTYSWRASFWGYDSGFLGGEFGAVQNVSTAPGYTSTIYMNQVCSTHDTAYQWRTDIRTSGGSVLANTAWASRSCHR